MPNPRLQNDSRTVIYTQSVIKLYNISVSVLSETKILQTNKKIYFSSGFHQQSVLSFQLKLLQIPPNNIIIYCKKPLKNSF